MADHVCGPFDAHAQNLRLLLCAAGMKIAVIENEFGEVNIDEALVSENMQFKEDIVSMDNGHDFYLLYFLILCMQLFLQAYLRLHTKMC